VRVIGLMSGTSADGVDAALVEWPENASALPFQLLAAYEEALPTELQRRIHDLAAGRVAAGDALRELAALDVELGERFAASARGVAERAGVALSEIDAIASHGQTVAHHPELRASLQIGDPSVIAERTGCLTLADFRTRDLAAGGEGAPLAPFFHQAAFGDSAEGRLILNLGGIANVTWLPPGGDPDAAVAFDVGPANSLIDGVGRVEAGSTRRCSGSSSPTSSCNGPRRSRRGASATVLPRPRRWRDVGRRRHARSTTWSRPSWPLPRRASPTRRARTWAGARWRVWWSGAGGLAIPP
jgi:anhydro-N-acetylmuramic acid kinase